MSTEIDFEKKPSFLYRVKTSPSTKSMKGLSSLLRTVLKNIWYELSNAPMGVRKLYLGNRDVEFVSIENKVTYITRLSPGSLFSLYQLVKNVFHLKGDIAEFGVYKGGSAKILALLSKKYAPAKKVYLFDTWEGMPFKTNRYDVYKPGDLGDVSFEKVQEFLHDLPNVIFCKGLFAITNRKVEAKHFCFVHIDVDLYSSVMEACCFFYPLMVVGGIMVFDDYGFVSCPGAKKAVDEFFQNKSESPIYLTTGQCIVIKQ